MVQRIGLMGRCATGAPPRARISPRLWITGTESAPNGQADVAGRFASGLSDTPRIAQGGKPSQRVTTIDAVVHQQAFDEGVHRVLSISIGGQETAPPERGSITRPRSHQTRAARQRERKRFSFRFGAIR